MAGSLKRIRSEMKIRRSPKDAGWILPIEVGVYDNGMISVNKTPINTSPEYDQALGWTGATVIIAQYLDELREEVNRRGRGA